MLGNLKGLAVTLRTLFRKPVTHQYPNEHKPIEEQTTYNVAGDKPSRLYIRNKDGRTKKLNGHY